MTRHIMLLLKKHNLLDQFLNRIVSQIENYDGENWIDKYAEGME